MRQKVDLTIAAECLIRRAARGTATTRAEDGSGHRGVGMFENGKVSERFWAAVCN